MFCVNFPPLVGGGVAIDDGELGAKGDTVGDRGDEGPVNWELLSVAAAATLAVEQKEDDEGIDI